MEFKGSSSPSIYIIDHHSHPEDLEMGYPLSGPRGQYLCSLLGSMGVLQESRFACWTEMGPAAVIEDIVRCDPKVIIGLGSELLRDLVGTNRPIMDVSGSIYKVNMGGKEYPYLVLVSPSYVLRRIEDQGVALKFSQDLYKAYQVITGEWRDIFKEKEVLSAHSFKEFVSIYERLLIDSPKISYDIETNARPPMTEGSRIIGFSVGKKEGGVYVSIDSLDFHMPKEEEDKIWSYLINEIFKKKRLQIHNTMYERPYTLCCKGYEIKFEDADDTLVKARLLRSPKEPAGLKYQAQKYMHYPDWETDLGNYIDGFQGVVNRIAFGPRKYELIWKYVAEGGNILYIYEAECFKNLSEVEDKEGRSDKKEVESLFKKMTSTCQEYYPDDLEGICKLISEKLVYCVNSGGIKDSIMPYNWIPDRILSKYGAIDAIGTADLDFYFDNVMDEESTDKVDLHKGYENWLEHMYVAYIMERNGLNWNEDLVRQDESFLINQSNKCMREMLLSPIFEPYIIESCAWRYKPLIFADYLPDIANSQGFEVRYDHLTDKYSVYYNGKRVARDRLNEVKITGANKTLFEDLVKKMLRDYVDSHIYYEELTELFNPSSPSTNDVIREILVNETLQMGGRINHLHNLSISPEFEGCKEGLCDIDKKFLLIADKIVDAKSLREDYGNDWWKTRLTFYNGFVNLYNSYRGQVSAPEIKQILYNKEPVKIESFDDTGMIEVYNNLVVTGIDQDNRESWTPQFEWMMNFRLYKKSQKLISTYINGSVGRASVHVVDKKGYSEGSDLIVRKRPFSPSISKDESYILNAIWSPNTAETGRWRSAIHTIPWGSQVKKYYTSRFKGGIMVCPDYSQMEVRTLSAVAHDENMLELFRSGKDFHSQTAASIWNKPVEEVTPAERRFSKTATFSLLYGAMEESFARNYCNGDMSMAEKIYGGFMKAYPGVKKWVEERHKEAMESGKISLELSNRFITLEKGDGSPSSVAALLRKSQNYPIQAQSADLTGCVIYDIQKYIEENHLLSKIVMYVHDSIEIDIYPFEMIQMLDTLKFILNDSPMKRMGLPSKADVTLGASLGHEIEMKSIEYNEDKTEATLVLAGFKDEIEETVDIWRGIYKTVEVSEEEWEDKYISMSELFIVKKAYSPVLGTTRQEGKCKVHLDYYK